MSQSGQQHPKADVGGQRADPKKSEDRKPGAKGSTRAAVDAGKKDVAKSDAKK